MGRRKTKDEFINDATIIHGNVYVYENVEYINNRTKVSIICPTHGAFLQSPINHLKGKGCPKCKGVRLQSKYADTKDDFITKAKLAHTIQYDYSKVKYINARTKVCIICPEHGEFWQTPDSHIHGRGCPICKQSKGEMSISKWLIDHNIDYEPQKTFSGCKYVNPLPFDFYIPSHNMLIEYDGIQHHIPKEFFGGVNRLKEQKLKDLIKTNYCSSNNVNLIRIRYDQYEDIDEILYNLF